MPKKPPPRIVHKIAPPLAPITRASPQLGSPMAESLPSVLLNNGLLRIARLAAEQPTVAMDPVATAKVLAQINATAVATLSAAGLRNDLVLSPGCAHCGATEVGAHSALCPYQPRTAS